MALKVVFMGTPIFSVAPLAAILDAGHQVVAVYSQPPRPAGRGMAAKLSPVHERANRNGIPVLTPRSLRTDEAVAIFRSHEADVAVVVAYGLILPTGILAAPRLGCLNLHASRLPRWRGAAPIQRAIMAGDAETAVMVMRMEAGLDTGPIGLARAQNIEPDMTAGDLHDQLSRAGASLMVEALAKLDAGTLQFIPQPEEGITYARKIEKAEAAIDFDASAAEVHNHIRGLSPFPGAWFEAVAGGRTERIKVLRTTLSDWTGTSQPGTVLDDVLTVACRTGAVRLIELQRAGKKPIQAGDFLRGFDLKPGTILGGGSSGSKA